MTLLDTNIILRFILDDEPNLSAKARAIFEKIEQEKINVFLSILAISEVIFTLERSYKLPRAKIAEKVLAIAKLPNIVVERQEMLSEIFDYYTRKNLSFIDSYHIALMNKKKINNIYSFDHDFDKFPKIKRLES